MYLFSRAAWSYKDLKSAVHSAHAPMVWHLVNDLALVVCLSHMRATKPESAPVWRAEREPWARRRRRRERGSAAAGNYHGRSCGEDEHQLEARNAVKMKEKRAFVHLYTFGRASGGGREGDAQIS